MASSRLLIGWPVGLSRVMVTSLSSPKRTFSKPYAPSFEAQTSISPRPAERLVEPFLSVYLATAGKNWEELYMQKLTRAPSTGLPSADTTRRVALAALA